MLPPLPRCSRWAYSSLKLANPCQPSPIPLSGRPAHRPFRGLLGVHSRCGLHTRAVTKLVTAIRGLQTFRHLHACPGCFRLERIAGWGLHPLESAALSRRTWVTAPLFSHPYDTGLPRCARNQTYRTDHRSPGCSQAHRDCPYRGAGSGDCRGCGRSAVSDASCAR
jgi:hypothetical protein